MTKIRLSITPARLIALGFLMVILAGAGLLCLPFASKGVPASFLEALLTSTSATCVTGLVVRDTFAGWTGFGQGVILLLIQIGGLGFMTVITLASHVLGKRLGLFDRKVLMQSAGNITLSGVGSLVWRIIPFAFVLEGIGAVLLAIRFVPEFGWGRGIWFSCFHAISAFCNAGFDLMGAKVPFSSMTDYVSDPLVSLTLCGLIIIGGLGFLVWRDMVKNKLKWSKYQLHTKVVLATTGILLLGGTILFLAFEWNHTMAGMTFGQRLLASFFQSVTPRTAGFNTLELTALSEAGNLLTNVLMLIGGSPGSTAGGIKTTTLAVLVISTVSSARGKTRVTAFRYSIDRDTIRQSCSIAVIYLSLTVLFTMLLCAVEPITLKEALFETCSAIGTVGLSLSITPQLSAIGHLVVILLMYAGRIGGLTFVLLFGEKRSEPPVDRPTGKLLVG